MNETSNSETAKEEYELRSVVVPLLKGVIYRDDKPAVWSALLNLQAAARDYVAVLGLDLILDEAEGYAYLRSRAEDDPDESKQARLISRRQLSFPVSLLLALLRKKLVEFDAGGGDTRLILTSEEIADLMRVFLPEAGNEIKLLKQIDGYINKIVDLGFLRKLRGQEKTWEVRRILAAFVDAQWLADLDNKLAAYHAHWRAQSAAPGEAEGERR